MNLTATHQENVTQSLLNLCRDECVSIFLYNHANQGSEVSLAPTVEIHDIYIGTLCPL